MTERPRLSLRIDLPGGARFGPGKAALLDAISQTGSIRAAAERLEMSYPRALKLIEDMNQDFVEPLVISQHGGAAGGGTQVTEMGTHVLELYREACAKAEQSAGSVLSVIGGYQKAK